MDGAPCWFVTLTRGRCLDTTFRADIWYTFRTRLLQRWPAMQAWTVLEWGRERGIHLHAVLRGTPGITAEWVQHLADLAGTAAHMEEVVDPVGLAGYLTKGLLERALTDAWPRYFRPVSQTRGWCPRAGRAA
jgi:hypothetical protein